LALRDVEWNNPNMRLNDMWEYTATVITNDLDELLEAPFFCERVQFKNDDAQWRSTLEEAFMNRLKMSYSEKKERDRDRDREIAGYVR
jgi:hypothetical protein